MKLAVGDNSRHLYMWSPQVWRTGFVGNDFNSTIEKMETN